MNQSHYNYQKRQILQILNDFLYLKLKNSFYHFLKNLRKTSRQIKQKPTSQFEPSQHQFSFSLNCSNKQDTNRDIKFLQSDRQENSQTNFQFEGFILGKLEGLQKMVRVMKKDSTNRQEMLSSASMNQNKAISLKSPKYAICHTQTPQVNYNKKLSRMQNLRTPSKIESALDEQTKSIKKMIEIIREGGISRKAAQSKPSDQNINYFVSKKHQNKTQDLFYCFNKRTDSKCYDSYLREETAANSKCKKNEERKISFRQSIIVPQQRQENNYVKRVNKRCDTYQDIFEMKQPNYVKPYSSYKQNCSAIYPITSTNSQMSKLRNSEWFFNVKRRQRN